MNVIDNPDCVICKQSVETMDHILCECLLASDVWGHCARSIQKSGSNSQAFKEQVEKQLANLTQEEMEEFAVMCWKIWKRRNEFIFNDNFKHPLNWFRRQIF